VLIMARRWWLCRSSRLTARVTIVECGEAMTGQLVGKLKDLGKNLHERKNINSAKNINSGFS
jgi:AmiR/NasT family two-component response regulator